MAITINVSGEYYSVQGTVKQVKDFTETIKAPSLEFFRQTNQKYLGTDDSGKLMFRTNSFINIRGRLKKQLLPQLLTKKYPDFVRIRKITIDSILSSDGATIPELPVVLQSREQLAELIKARQMPIDPASYMDLDALRSDILLFQEDPDTFMAGYAARQAKRAEEREFMELNNLVPAAPAPKKGKSAGTSVIE